jgi:hypothetical protein
MPTLKRKNANGQWEYIQVSGLDVSQLKDEVDSVAISLADITTNQLPKKASNYVANVMDYGAVSNQTVTYDAINKVYTGMTDSTTAFQNAVNSGYNVIIVPQGNYFINSQITIPKKVLIISYGANIYTNPTTATKRIFSLGSSASGTQIDGLSFYSKNEYTATMDASATTKVSYVTAIDINGANDIIIKNCYGECMSMLASCMNCNNIDLNYLKSSECYFPVYTGFSASYITIRNSYLKTITNADIYGHALYLAYASHYITVDNCTLEMPGSGSNIVKVGSNEGAGDHVVLKNCKLIGVATNSILYVNNGADISLYDCILDFKSGTGGYARLLQFNDNSTAYFKGCTFTLDSFDKYTQNTSYVNNSIIFDECNFTVKNTIVSFCKFAFIAGANTFRFNNCRFDRTALIGGSNLLDPALYALHLFNCKLLLNGSENIGIDTQTSVTYSQSNTPKFRAINCEFQRTTDANANVFLSNISYNSYVPLCQLINVTLINCDAKSGGNTGLYKLASVDSQYVLNNVLNIAK